MSTSSTLLLIIFYLIFYKRNSDKKFWVIFLYLVLSYISDKLLYILKFDRFYSFSFFTLIELTIFSYFFYLSFREKSFKRLLILCYPIFCGVLAYSIIYEYKTIYDFDYVSSSFEAILIIISILHWRYTMQSYS